MYVCVFSRLVMSDSLWFPWTVARQSPLSMGLSRQEYWSGSPFPPPGDLLTQGSNPRVPHLLHCRWILYHCTTWETQQVNREKGAEREDWSQPTCFIFCWSLSKWDGKHSGTQQALNVNYSYLQLRQVQDRPCHFGGEPTGSLLWSYTVPCT